MSEFQNKCLVIILFLFILISSLFVRWPGMNEYSRLFLSISTVFDNSFSIDNYYNQTGDRSYFLGRYYSDKEPGVSILIAPMIFLLKNVFEISGHKPELYPVKYFIEYHNDQPIVVANLQPLFIRISQFLAVFFASTIPTAITGFLVYKIVKQFTGNDRLSLISIVSYLFSSMAFHYSLIFINHAFSSFIVLLSAYLLVIKKYKESSLIAGLGFIIDPQILPIYLAATSVYLILERKIRNVTLLFLFGFYLIIGVTPMLIYNFSIFGKPFSFPREHLDPVIWSKLPGYHGIIIDPKYNVNSAIRMLFFPYRGIFFYYPVFLLSFLVFFNLDKRIRIISMLSMIVFLVNLSLASMWWAWWHGASFSERHLVISAPFLSILLGLSLKNKLKKKYFKLVFLILLIYSFMTNIVGLQEHYEDMIKDPSNSFMKEYYKERFEKFLPLENVLFDYYYRNFFRYGIYSPIIENLFNNRTFSVIPL